MKKNPTRGLQGQTACPNLRWGEEVQGPALRTSQGMGVGSPPPVQGDLLKYRRKIKHIQDGNSLRIHLVSFSVVGLYHVPI